jgi:hypothetical protein
MLAALCRSACLRFCLHDRAHGFTSHQVPASTRSSDSGTETAASTRQRAGRPYDAGCAQLAFGEHLRRAGRRVDARGHLKQALDTFRDLAAEPLAERAAAELRAPPVKLPANATPPR